MPLLVAANFKLTSAGQAVPSTPLAGTLWKTLNNPNAFSTSANDSFGYSVAVSGNYVVISAVGEESYAGRVYVFDASNGSLLHTIANPNAYGTTDSDQFGVRVSISGNTIIVGAYGEDETGGTDSGKAYLFDASNGSLLHTIANPNAYGTPSNDAFGYRVSISGNRAIVGAYTEDEAGGNNSGKAYIFDVATGALVWTLNNPNAAAIPTNDYFGNSVGISGNYAIVSSPYETDAGGVNSGKAYIFDVATGALVWTLNNPNAYGVSGYDYFGSNVAISGNYAIVGTTSEADAGGTNSGKAYIFDVTTGTLWKTLNNPNSFGTSDLDLFGFSVAIDGNYAVVSAAGEDDASGSPSGKAYIFDVTTGSLLKTLNNPNAYGSSSGDQFGVSVAISGNNVVVGANMEDEAGGTNSGKVYLFN